MIFDEREVANLVKFYGVKKGKVDCPHCGFRWGLIIASDSSDWMIWLVEFKEGEKNE
jgi:hypothetical protein